MQLLKFITLTYGSDPSTPHHQTTRDVPSDWEDEPQSHNVPDSADDAAPADSPQEDEPESEIITSKGQFTLISQFDHYTFRREDLSEYCVYDYCSLFYKKKAQSGSFTFDNDHKQHHSHRQFFTNPAIPTLL